MSVPTPHEIQDRYDRQLQRVLEIQHQVQDIHPWLEQPFPIALVEADQFHVFDLEAGHYRFVRQAPTPMPIPVGVRAAFPLECYDGRSACVVTGDVFDTLDGYATILHEFVHCQQWETCEPRTRGTLDIARQAKAREDLMWEINYAFPYDDPVFVEAYEQFLEALLLKRDEEAMAARARLRQTLNGLDFEYMAWQEWKEGFARYVENRVKRRLFLPENHGGAMPPFSRVTLYEGGSRLIELLGERAPELLVDVEALWHRIRDA